MKIGRIPPKTNHAWLSALHQPEEWRLQNWWVWQEPSSLCLQEECTVDSSYDGICCCCDSIELPPQPAACSDCSTAQTNTQKGSCKHKTNIHILWLYFYKKTVANLWLANQMPYILANSQMKSRLLMLTYKYNVTMLMSSIAEGRDYLKGIKNPSISLLVIPRWYLTPRFDWVLNILWDWY